jgi:hypothetical protein
MVKTLGERVGLENGCLEFTQPAQNLSTTLELKQVKMRIA